MAAESPWVLVEGPAPGSAEFLGRWLLAAAEADRELHDQHARNPSLKQQIFRLEIVYMICFSPAACKFIELLMGDGKNVTCFALDLCEEEWGEMFTVMTELGFFSPTENRYQMTIPKDISGLKIEAALLRLAATEDADSYLHPESLVNWLPKTEAQARVANRELPLGAHVPGPGDGRPH
jgi:hypothetical protein